MNINHSSQHFKQWYSRFDNVPGDLFRNGCANQNGSVSLYFPDCLFGEDRRRQQSGARIIRWSLGGGGCTHMQKWRGASTDASNQGAINDSFLAYLIKVIGWQIWKGVFVGFDIAQNPGSFNILFFKFPCNMQNISKFDDFVEKFSSKKSK